MTPCLDDETIAAWASDGITADERERSIEHAASCEVCRAVLAHAIERPAATPARIGRYEILGAIGAGGMGVVLRARDPALGREVALKMIKSTLVEPAHRERMLHEAQAMAQVTHPNVVTVHELGEAGDEVYVAMEHVRGTMLQRWLASPRPRSERAAVALGLGRGIAAVHAAGLLHRDIKPDNVLVRPDGTPVLVDFGLARTITARALGAGSGVAGTPRYLAPEVAAGAPAAAASDQYQWWTIVDELLGEVPRVAPLVARGHAADPARRFPAMLDAVAALEAALARPAGAAGRRWWIAGALVAGAAAVVAVLALRSGDDAGCDVPLPRSWSADRRGAVERGLRAAGVEPVRVLAAIDERVATSRALRVRACRESPRSRATRAAWTRREVCLDETWAKTARELDDMTSGDPARVREAADDLVEVLPAERCARGALPALPMTLAPEARARYEALAKRVQAIEMDRQQTPQARTASLRALAPELAQLGYAPLDARWHWAIAHTLSDTRDTAGAALAFDRAAQAGLAAGDDDLYVRALIAELHVVTTAASAERVAQLEAQATAGAQRLGNPQVDAQLLLARANAHMDRGDAAAARALFEQAAARYAEIAVAPMAMHVAALQNLGALCLEAGDLDAAERHLARAVELAAGRYGRDAAPRWEASAARATVLVAKGDLARAETELRAAADGLARTAPDGGQLGMTHAYLCAVGIAQAKLADARAACAASVAAIARVLGDDSPGLVWPLTLSGQVELRASAAADALRFLRRAVALATAGHVRPIERTVAEAYLAIALRAAKQPAEARALAAKVAPALAAPEVAESRADFVRAFPELAAIATPR